MKELLAKSILIFAGLVILFAVSFMAYEFFEADVLIGLLFVSVIAMSFGVAWAINVLS